jgi:MFS family permease
LATTFINIFFGSLVRKFGVRKLIAAGFVFMAVSALINAHAQTLWAFYAAGIILGFGNALTGTTMGSFIVSRWCQTNVGKLTGLVLSANGIGGAVAAQIITPMIYSEMDPFGYRNAYKMVAVIMVITAVVVTVLMREKPADGSSGITPSQKKTPIFDWEGIPFETAKKRPYFYIMAVCTLLTGMILYGISGTQAPHMRNIQVSPAVIASVVSLSSVLLTFSKVLVGAACDKYGFRPVLLVCHLFSVAAVILIGLITPTSTGIAIAVVASVLIALALPLETIMVPLLVKHLFGAASYAKVLGIYMAFSTVGFAIGSPLTNLSYDILGSYVPYFYISAGIMLLVAVIAQFVMQVNMKDKKQLLNKEA